MRKAYFLLCSLTLIFTACRTNTSALPEGILPVDSMTAVLADLQLAEAALSQGGFDSLEKWRVIYTTAVLEKHKLSQEKLDTSFRYYERQPEVFGKMLDEVIIILNMREKDPEWINSKDTLDIAVDSLME